MGDNGPSPEPMRLLNENPRVMHGILSSELLAREAPEAPKIIKPIATVLDFLLE